MQRVLDISYRNWQFVLVFYTGLSYFLPHFFRIKMIKLSHFLVFGVLIVIQLFVQIKTQGPLPPPNNVNRPPDNPINRPPDNANRPMDPIRPDERLQRPAPIPPPPLPPRPLIPMQGPPRPLPPPPLPPPRQNNPPFPPVFPGAPRPPIAVGFNPDRIRIEGFVPIQKRSMAESSQPLQFIKTDERKSAVAKRDITSWRQKAYRAPQKIARPDFVNVPIGKKIKFTNVQFISEDQDRPSDDIPKKPFSETEPFNLEDSLSIDESIRRSLAEKLKVKFPPTPLDQIQFVRSGNSADVIRVKGTDGVTLTPEAGFLALNQTDIAAPEDVLSPSVMSTTIVHTEDLLQLQGELQDASREDQDVPVLEEQPANFLDDISASFSVDTPLEGSTRTLADTVTFDQQNGDEDVRSASTQEDRRTTPITVDPDDVTEIVEADVVVQDFEDDEVPEDEQRDEEEDEKEDLGGDEDRDEELDEDGKEDLVKDESEHEREHAEIGDVNLRVPTLSPVATVNDSEASRGFIHLEEINAKAVNAPPTSSALRLPDRSAEATSGPNVKQAVHPGGHFNSNASTIVAKGLANNGAQSNISTSQATPSLHPEDITNESRTWWETFWGEAEEKETESGKSEENIAKERSGQLDDSEDFETEEDIIAQSTEAPRRITPEATVSIRISSITVETIEEVVIIGTSPERRLTIQFQTSTKDTTPPTLTKPVYNAYPSNIGRHSIINPTEGTLLARIVHFIQENAGAIIGLIMGTTVVLLMIYVLYLRCKRRRSGKLEISPGPLHNGEFPRFEEITKPRTCSVRGKEVVVDGCEEVLLTEMGSVCLPKFKDSLPCQPKVLHVEDGTVGAF